VGLRASLDLCEKSRPPLGFDPRTVKSVASRYPTHSNTKPQFNGMQLHNCVHLASVSVQETWQSHQTHLDVIAFIEASGIQYS
jgi:hypothetical protein